MAMTTTQKIIAIAVTIIIISTVAAPVIQDIETGYTAEEMNTGSRFSLASTSEVITINKIDGFACINGVSIRSIFPDVASTVLAIVSDSMVANLYFQSGTYANLYVTSPDLFPDASNYTKEIAGGTIVFDSGTVTYTSEDEETVTSTTYEYVFVPDQDGNYGSWSSSGGTFTDPIYVDSGKSVYLYYRTTNNILSASGTLDSISSNFFVNSGSLDTDTEITMNYEHLANGSNRLDSVSFSPSFLGSVSILAPLKYTTVTNIEDSGLFGVIMILLFLVPLMMAVRMITLRRN